MSRPPDDVMMVRFVPDEDMNDNNAVAAAAFAVAGPDAPRPPRGSAAGVRARREPSNSHRDSRAKPRARGVTFLELPDAIAVPGHADDNSPAPSPANPTLPRLQQMRPSGLVPSSPILFARRDTEPGRKSPDMPPAAAASRRSTFRKTVVAPSRPLADLTDAPSFPPRALGSFVGSKDGREKRLTDARRRATLQRKREQLQRGNAPELRAESSVPSFAPDVAAARGGGSVAFGRGHGAGAPRQRQRHVTVAVGARRGRERARTLHKLHKGGNAASSGAPGPSTAATASGANCDPESEDSNESSDSGDSGDSDFVLDIRRERLRCERREARRRARREARQEQRARLAYLDKPGRRHTSARAKTFIADRPELLSMLKAYYMPRYPQGGGNGGGNSDEGASQANPQGHVDDTNASTEAAGEHQQQEEQEERSGDVGTDTHQRAGQRRGSLGVSSSIVADVDAGTTNADSAGASKNTPAVSVTISLKADHEAQYANNEHYSDQALLQREALKFDPQVLRVLDEIWRVTDADGNGRIDKGEYVQMSTKLYRVVVGIDTGIGSGSDGTSMRDERQVRHARRALRFAHEEWENDRLGLDYLDRPRFTQAWFQLTDLWTENICAEEYARFLGDVLECLTVRIEDECGRLTEDREWRTDTEICTLAEWQAGGGRLAPRRRQGCADGETSSPPPRQARGTVVAVSPKKAPTRGRAPSFMARRNDAGFFKIRRSTIAAMRRLSQAVGGSAHAMQQALKRVVAMDTLGEMSEGSDEDDEGEEEQDGKGEDGKGRKGSPSSAVDEAVRALGSKTRREIAALVAFHGRRVQKPVGRAAAGTASASGYVHSKSSAERPPAYAGVYSETGRHNAAIADMLDGQAMLSHTSVKYAGAEGVQLYSSMPLRAMHYGGGYHYDPSGGQQRAGARGMPPPLEPDDWEDGTVAAGQRGRVDGAAAAQALIAAAQQRNGKVAADAGDAGIESLVSALMMGAQTSQGGNAMFVSDNMEEALLGTLKVRYQDGESEESKNAHLGEQRRRQVEEAMQRLASEYEPQKSNFMGHGHIDRRKLLGDALGAAAPDRSAGVGAVKAAVGSGDGGAKKSKVSRLHWIHMEGEHYVPGAAATSGTDAAALQDGADGDGNSGNGLGGSWLASPTDKARLGSELCQAKMRERRKRRGRRQRRAKLGSAQYKSSIGGLGRGAIQQLLEHGDAGGDEGGAGEQDMVDGGQDQGGESAATGEGGGDGGGEDNGGNASPAAKVSTFDRGTVAVAPSMGSRNFCGKAIQILATDARVGVVNDAGLGASHFARGPESESKEVQPWTRLMSLKESVSTIRYPRGGELKSRFVSTFEEPAAEANVKRDGDGDGGGKRAQQAPARLLRPLAEVKAQDADTEAVDMARAKRYDFATHASVRYQSDTSAKKRATIHAGRGKEQSTGGFVVMW